METKKTLVITKSNGTVSVDPSTLEVKDINSEREAISRIILADDDYTVKYGDYTRDAKKGDLIIVFYERYFPYKFVIVDCAEWLENLTVYNEKINSKNTLVDEACKLYTECDQCVIQNADNGGNVAQSPVDTNIQND